MDRFAALVEKDLKKRQADVIEFYQPLSPSMAEIQTAVLECMEATLSEIKRSNTSVSQRMYSIPTDAR
jgi:DNA excision repair protein ERCC-4